MDLNRTITGPAVGLVSALTGAGRLAELVRVLGEHLVHEFDIEVFDTWWFQAPPREAGTVAWARAEFRVPGVRVLPGPDQMEACRLVELDLEDCEFSPPGQAILRADQGFSRTTGFQLAIRGNQGRWLVLFLRESPLAAKSWRARWIARSPGSDGRESSIPDGVTADIRAAMIDVALNVFAGHVRRQFELEDARSELYRDDLTGLYNSRYLDLALDMEVRRATRFGTKFCVLFVDVDSFKAVNDNHGHLSGSSLLGELGSVVKDAVREVDIVARYGGDEFVLVLLGASIETGSLIAERVRDRVAAHKFRTVAGGEVQVTVSIGIAAFPENATSKEQLLRMADETMYASKKDGKNRVTVYDSRQPVPAARPWRDSGDVTGGING